MVWKTIRLPFLLGWPILSGGVDEFRDQSQWIVGELGTTFRERCHDAVKGRVWSMKD